MTALHLALSGRLQDTLRRQRKDLAVAATGAARQVAQEFREEVRRTIQSAGLGPKVARAFRSRVYPQHGFSIDAAAYFWSKAPRIMQAFSKDTTILPRRGRALAIPTEAALTGRIGRFRPTPARLREQGINLRLVPARGRRRHAMLVADLRVTSRGRARRIKSDAKRKPRQGLVSVPMFILIPRAFLKQRVDIEKLAEKATDDFARYTFERWVKRVYEA